MPPIVFLLIKIVCPEIHFSAVTKSVLLFDQNNRISNSIYQPDQPNYDKFVQLGTQSRRCTFIEQEARSALFVLQSKTDAGSFLLKTTLFCNEIVRRKWQCTKLLYEVSLQRTCAVKTKKPDLTLMLQE